MIKKLTALCLTLTLLLGMTTAFAWSCPECGYENGGKFCTECGTKKPAQNACPSCGMQYGDKLPKFCTECGTKLDVIPATPTAPPTATPTATPTASPVPTETPAPVAEEPSIIDVFETDGMVSIMWKADGETNYQIRYMLKRSDDVQADLAAANGLGYFYQESTLGLCVLRRLVPGESYWIGVFDEEGRGHYAPFTPLEEVKPFTAFSNYLSGWPKLRAGGEDVKVDAFSQEDLDDAGKEPGVLLGMMFNNPGDEYKPGAQIVMEAPNGAKKVVAVTTITFGANKADVSGWNFVSLKEYFDLMKNRFGMVPAGDYKLTVYLDGKLLGELVIPVTGQAWVAPVPTATPTATPTAEPTVAPVLFAALNTNDNGTLTASWTGGVGPYTLCYMNVRSADFHADRVVARKYGTYWTAESEWTEQSYTFRHLVPGEAYWIVVTDANGNGRYRKYTPAPAKADDDFNSYLEVIPRAKKGEKHTDLGCISSDVAGLVDDTEHGAQIYLNYTNPGAPVEKHFQLAFVLPNGEMRVDYSGFVTLESGESRWLGWQFYSLEDHLQMLRVSNAIPKGDVSVRVYLDGKLAGEGVLPVRTTPPVEISTVMHLVSGKVILNWADNGCGPYDVHYIMQFSEDYDADREDDRNVTRWSAVTDTSETNYTLEHLIPGVSYWITVTDSNGSVGKIVYSVPAPERLEPGVTFYGEFRQKVNDEVSSIDGFSAAQINKQDDIVYGLYLEMKGQELSEEVVRPVQWVMTLPNGGRFCFSASDLTWYKSGACHWTFFSLDWALNLVNGWYDGVLIGTYEVDLYVEGDYAGGFTFGVTE